MRWMIAIGIAGLMLWGGPAVAQQAGVTWQQLEERGGVLEQEADEMLKARNHPRIKDYYKASKMFSEAALAYEHARTLKQHLPLSEQQQLGWTSDKNQALTQRIYKLRLRSDQARRMAISREGRGLL